ncbi:hypothetical protein NLG97_g7642 [Lecanicillium saksenae]|uniref:Uncharacterized protein n=1 Tax=Lecanicillium saksenae TaxID=468837 RepID=A0ACC1QP71_9HYPO|nr:hypothetical protein NLG97_g7642 [Lecanicillium saksenae]
MYDSETGLVINQWTISARRPTRLGSLDWSRTAPLKYQEPPGKQARPLVDMAIRAVAKNIGMISKELLEPIPLRVLWRLWRFLEARGGACLHAWKIFSELLMNDDGEDQVLGLYRFRQHVCRPDEELKLYTQPLDSASVDFITHITISGHCLFSGNELLSLASMKNLGVLELIKPADNIMASYPTVNDRILRGWSEMEAPFPLLRVLRIWGDQSVSDVSLRWVAKFPSLVLYDVMAGKDDWASAYEEAAATGWHVAQQVRRAEDSSILRYLMLVAPGEEIPMKRFSALSRSIDIDLINLCSDPRCVLKRVPLGEAPPLLDYLVDPAKVAVRLPTWERDASLSDRNFCHETAFEAWAFCLYSLIGQLCEDRDLERNEARPGQQTVAGPFVLPSKPMTCLYLGHSGQGGISSKPSYISRGLFATKRFTFTRLGILNGVIPTNTRVAARSESRGPESARQPALVKHNKRRRIEDVLDSFG